MEFLVTMTTHVPEGTSEEAVGEMRAREAVRARQLAAEGRLLRLWRPPLQPGEWRTLGLFAAEDAEQLEKNLASMPLRAWRTDEVTSLMPHVNDPAAGSVHSPAQVAVSQAAASQATNSLPEFFTTFTLSIPPDVPEQTAQDTLAREAERARELGAEGRLVRLWKLSAEPGVSRALGLWRADGAEEMQAIVASLPLDAWMTVQTTALTPHPNDPASDGRRTR